MKTSTFILSYVITFIIIVALCVSGAVCQQKKDAQIYNNGVHAIDGGTSRLLFFYRGLNKMPEWDIKN